MKTLVVDHRQVRELLPMAECIDAMAEALAGYSAGTDVQPLRTITRQADRRGLIGLMPAYVGGLDAPGVKVVTVFPGNHGTRFDSHQGVVLLFEGRHGCLRAVIDAGEVTAIRTAAASGAATRLLACEDAGELAILGSGVQARTHLEAMAAVRPIRRARVWSRTAGNARRFAAAAAERYGFPVEAVAEARAAVEGADLVCTTTAATEPVLEGAWLAPGAHVNAVGACFPTARELDAAAVVRARLFVDARESALHEAGDFLLAKAEGAVGDDHVAGEIGEVVRGTVEGRRSDDEITLFKSLGIAVEDVVAAHLIYRKAAERGGGTWLELGAERGAAD